MDRKKLFFKVTTLLVAVVTLFCAVWIMANRLGLSDGLDFGAGAYYYADIPGFENIVREDAYRSSVPVWVHIVLFLGWGWLMWRLWVWVDRRGRKG